MLLLLFPSLVFVCLVVVQLVCGDGCDRNVSFIPVVGDFQCVIVDSTVSLTPPLSAQLFCNVLLIPASKGRQKI